MRVLVLATNAYDFADRAEASRRVVGNSVIYTTGQTHTNENGTYVEQVNVKDNSEQIMRAVYEVPGVYEIEQIMGANRSGKPIIKIASARLVKSVDLAAIIEELLSTDESLPPPRSYAAPVPTVEQRKIAESLTPTAPAATGGDLPANFGKGNGATPAVASSVNNGAAARG